MSSCISSKSAVATGEQSFKVTEPEKEREDWALDVAGNIGNR